MLASAWLYGTAGLFFFVAGLNIAPAVNAISARILPFAPRYPLPEAGPEGTFWLTLSLSMMVMITWICRAAYMDLRRNGRLVPILLISKGCSSIFYLFYLLTQGQLVHLVGIATDLPLFLVTLALWIPASNGARVMTEREEEIMAAVGEALLPRGGAFVAGYVDLREACLDDARRMLAAQFPIALAATRFLLHLVDLTPLLLGAGTRRLCRMSLETRQTFLRRIENHRFPLVRNAFIAVKALVVIPFFNQEEAARAVGYLSEEAAS